MRVAVVTESFLPSINGVTNSVLRILDTLNARGDDVVVIAPTSPEVNGESYPVFTVPHVPLGGFPVAIPTPAIAQVIERFRPDVIHAAAPFWLGGQSIAFAAKRGIPSVAVYQTHVAGYMHRYGLEFAGPIIDAMTYAIHRPATLSLAPTIDGQTYLNALGIHNVELWGRGVDTSLFNTARKLTPEVRAKREALGQGASRIVGYVGRLAPEKQVARLEEVCGLTDTRIVIVGDGPGRDELRERFWGYPVTFTGKLTGDELANTYAALDVFVHCGTEETFGQTIQEAHASGLPVVAPSEGGQRHLIRDGLDGFLVDHRRWGSYREAVERVLCNPDTLASMSRHARSAVESKTWEANNARLLDIYDRLVESSAAAIPVAA